MEVVPISCHRMPSWMHTQVALRLLRHIYVYIYIHVYVYIYMYVCV